MFTYKKTDDRSYCWFDVSGNMIHYIAYLVQIKKLKKDHVKISHFDKTMSVKFLNPKGYRYIADEEYYLYLLPHTLNGYLAIHMAFLRYVYVASWYRVDHQLLQNVLDTTWEELYGKDFKKYINALVNDEYDDEYHNKLFDEIMNEKIVAKIEYNENKFHFAYEESESETESEEEETDEAIDVV